MLRKILKQAGKNITTMFSQKIMLTHSKQRDLKYLKWLTNGSRSNRLIKILPSEFYKRVVNEDYTSSSHSSVGKASLVNRRVAGLISDESVILPQR